MFYRVDAGDRIVALSPDWDDHALANGGEGAVSALLLGRPLLDFLAGDTTRMFVAAAVQAVRRVGQTRELPYRCDTPTERCHYRMLLTPEPDGCVLVSHELLSSVPRAPLPLRSSRVGWRCSLCSSVRLMGSSEWLDTDVMPREPEVFDICHSCAQLLTVAKHGGASG